MPLPTLEIEPGHSSYFTPPRPELDPKLFGGWKVKSEIRQWILKTLYDFWRPRYADPESWSKVWIAGSAASYQWHGDRGTADLDILIGVDFEAFRRFNPGFIVYSEEQMAHRFNVEFYHELTPTTADWNGFEATWYVNPGARDIRNIHPYAAYNLTDDRWSVPPPQLPPEWNPRHFFPERWWQTVGQEIKQVHQMVHRYNVGGNEQARIIPDLLQIYDDIHTGRKEAFASGGQGYVDYANMRWQAHKMAGTEQVLRQLRDYIQERGLAG